MYQMLQPRLEIILFEIVFPLMCFNDNDQKLWDEDPHEYVRKGYGILNICILVCFTDIPPKRMVNRCFLYADIIEDLYSPRTAAMDFVNELVRKHGQDYLHKFIQFIVEIFKMYDSLLYTVDSISVDDFKISNKHVLTHIHV